MLNVLMPMAGSGKRFADAGYALPKPLIDVAGAPMVVRVAEGLVRDLSDFRLVCLVRDREVAEALRRWYAGATTIRVFSPTEGAACTCLLARELIDTDDPLLIANCDQLVPPEAVRALANSPEDGAVLTMKGDGSKKWSYIDTDVNGLITDVVEKEPISDRATCGLYWFREGRDFVRAAEAMIAADKRVNGEFYVAPVVDWLVNTEHDFDVAEVRVEDHGDGTFHGLGTPEDLRAYLGE